MSNEHLNDLAVYQPRKVGERRILELTASLPGRAAVEAREADGDTPAVEAQPAVPGRVGLRVEVEVPDAMAWAMAEARAQESLAAIRQNSVALTHYGLDAKAVSDQEFLALVKLITAVETFMVVVKDWNFAFEVAEGGAAVKAPINAVTVCDLMADTQVRGAWMVQLEGLTPLERAEGNG